MRLNRQALSYLALLCACFSLTANYGVVRPAVDSLFLAHFAASDRLWGMAVLPVLVTLLLWPYNYALKRLGPSRTMGVSTAISAVCLLVPGLVLSDGIMSFSGLARDPETLASLRKAAAFIGYLVKETYMVFLVEQLWSFATSNYSVERGKKLFGGLLILGGAGGMAGNEMQSLLAAPLGTTTVYLGSLVLLVPFWILMSTTYRLSTGQTRLSTSKDAGAGVGIRRLASSRYLLLIAVIVGLGQMMVACLDVAFHDRVLAAYPGLDDRSVFLANVWFYINGGATLLQLLTPGILRLFSVRTLHALFPISHLLAVGAAIVFPMLTTTAFAFAWFKSIDYSLFRACKDLLYVPLDFDARYRVKMVIDFVVYRSTKAGTALALAGVRSLALVSLAVFPYVALAAATTWLYAGVKLGNMFGEMAIETDGDDSLNVES